jgi:hypothetical protein
MSSRWFVSLYGVGVQGEMRPEQGRREKSHEMTQYLISFDHGAMDHIPDEEGPPSERLLMRRSRRPWTQACSFSPADAVTR